MIPRRRLVMILGAAGFLAIALGIGAYIAQRFALPLTIGMGGALVLACGALGTLGFVHRVRGNRQIQRVIAQRQEAEARYRHTVENAIEGMYRTTPDGKIEFVNPAMARILDFESSDALARVVIGKDFGFYVDGKRREALLDLLRLQDQVVGFESQMYRRDKTIIWVSENVSAVRDENGSLLAIEGSLVDISEQKRAAENLQASEARYRELADFLPQPVIELDSRGVPMYANQAAMTWYGLAVDELTDGNEILNRLVVPDDQGRASEAFSRALSGERLEGLEFDAVKGDGTRVPVLVFASPTSGDDGTLGVRLLVVDISRQKQVEAALRESEQRQSAILRSMPVAVYTAEVPSDLDASWISDSVARVTGFSADRFRSEPGFWSSRIHPDDADRVSQAFRQSAKRNEVTVEYRWRIADDSYRWFFDSAVCTHRHANGMVELTGIFRDVTEEKEAREALARSERHYRGLFDGAHDAILVFDPDTERVLDANAAACRIYQLGRREIIGMHLDSISKDATGGKRRIRETLQRGSVYSFETTQIRKDGSELMLEVNASVVDYDGRPAILSVNRDVSERRALEERLRQAQKLEAVGRLAGGVAHDFNNLLMAITGNSELVLKSMDPVDPRRSKVDAILRAGNRGTALTQQLLAFGRRQPVHPSQFDLNQKLGEVFSMVERVLGEDIVLDLDLCDRRLPIKIDPTQFEQVVLNLVVNARDAMGSGGRLTVRTTNRQISGDTGFDLSDGDYVVLEFEDDGVGMDADTMDQVFEPFFTTKDVGKGTGLGLATVYGIVRQAGGDISVDSRPGEGSRFTVLLPRTETNKEAKQSEVPAAPRNLEARVLVIEDDLAVRNSVVDMLECLGAETLEAANPAEARRLVGCQDGIDVVVSDIVMPGGTGDELARELQDRHPELAIVLMSGHAPEKLAQHGADAPAFTLLHKPFTLDALSQALHAALNATRGGERTE